MIAARFSLPVTKAISFKNFEAEMFGLLDTRILQRVLALDITAILSPN